MRLKSYWRLYQGYVRSDTRDEALEILNKASGSEHLLRLASHYAIDYGRLPDEFHNMVVLSGGKYAAEYLNNLSGNTERHGV